MPNEIKIYHLGLKKAQMDDIIKTLRYTNYDGSNRLIPRQITLVIRTPLLQVPGSKNLRFLSSR